MRAILWLAWHEATRRVPSFAAAVALVAAAVALCAGGELVARAREAAVAAQLDGLGPDLRLVPRGRSAVDLARHDLGTAGFSVEEVSGLRRLLSGRIRRLEGRLLLRETVRGLPTPLTGVARGGSGPSVPLLGSLRDDEAAAGAHLAATMGLVPGDQLVVRGRALKVAAVLPETAGVEDLALFLPVETLGKLCGLPVRFNELRIFLEPGGSAGDVVSFLHRQGLAFHAVAARQDEPAAREMADALTRHRDAIYLATAVVVALTVLIWSHLNAAERRVEMATLAAIGCPWTALLCLHSVRASMAGLLGSLVGWALGLAIAFSQDPTSASSVPLSGSVLLAVVAGGVGVSVAGAMPVAIHAAVNEHVRVLQEEV